MYRFELLVDSKLNLPKMPSLRQMTLACNRLYVNVVPEIVWHQKGVLKLIMTYF